MSLNSYAFFNTQTGLIENVIWCEDEVASSLVHPEGYATVVIPAEGIAGEWSTCGVGWSYIDGRFVEPINTSPVFTQGAAEDAKPT